MSRPSGVKFAKQRAVMKGLQKPRIKFCFCNHLQRKKNQLPLLYTVALWAYPEPSVSKSRIISVHSNGPFYFILFYFAEIVPGTRFLAAQKFVKLLGNQLTCALKHVN